ncbi:MFS transporter [Streptomyces sp. ISL-11]|uniref:MFS transporter n=1 Tax=Streptomyces sp. ISL-11 TaxID=2819174 RepID=UPI001BEADA02|nr:MFS transporter [Streptomyces sp. ISL-11]MBT2386637.1 MFS transporter [Streptomyces sp. ISL-11]
MLRVSLLALGALAVGTDAYMTAGLLPQISGEFRGSTAAAGQLVTVFAVSYALLAPPAQAALGRLGMRRILLVSLAVFTLANAAGAVAPDVTTLAGTRVPAGAAAGVFMPTAAATASLLAGPERRGRALALVLGGLSCGTVLGVPAGLLLAGHIGWRSALWLVAAVGAAAYLGVATLLPPMDSAPLPSLAERAAQLKDPRTATAVLTTFCQTVASLGLYTYLLPVLDDADAGPGGAGLWVWGLGGILGGFAVGHLLDRVPRPGLLTGLLLAALALVLAAITPAHGPLGVWPLLALWGAAGWAFVVPQQHRLLAAGPARGAAALALNSSATYLGGSAGAALGGTALAAGLAPRHLPLAAAGCAALALAVHLAGARNGERGLGGVRRIGASLPPAAATAPQARPQTPDEPDPG